MTMIAMLAMFSITVKFDHHRDEDGSMNEELVALLCYTPPKIITNRYQDGNPTT
jgi:hypothetical protein